MTDEPGFATRPGELAAAAGRFDEAARIVVDAVSALHATLDGLGNYLGTDEHARTFATRYEPRSAEGFAAFEQEARNARHLAESLRGSAGDYRGDDAGVADALRPPER